MRKAFRIARRACGAVIIAALFAGVAQAHGHEQSDARASIGGAHVVVHYGRPELKGRDPLKLIEPGQMWRLGADVPTTLETDSALDFGGTKVPKGKYVLLARLIEPGKWTLVVSRQPISKYEPSAKAAEIPLILGKDAKPAEEVTISLTGRGSRGQIEIRWGTLRLTGSFSAAK
jgi:Protein of unknown function (DUF2911)